MTTLTGHLQAISSTPTARPTADGLRVTEWEVVVVGSNFDLRAIVPVGDVNPDGINDVVEVYTDEGRVRIRMPR